MAQWSGQFSSLTHATKVQDAETSLRLAVKAFATAPEADRDRQKKRLHHLAERLTHARLKVVRAKISAMTEPGDRNSMPNKIDHLQRQEQELQTQDLNEVLAQLGVTILAD